MNPAMIVPILSRVMLWAGTASTGWFLSDWFNESNTTAQVEAQNPSVVVPSFWTQKRVIAAALGVIALFIWIRRGGLDKK